MYLTYGEYSAKGGTLTETAFTNIEYEARTYIDWYTFRRLQDEETIPNEVKECMYYLIDLIVRKMSAEGALSDSSFTATNPYSATVASQSNDGVSISYNIVSAKDIIDGNKQEIENVIKRGLQGVRNSLGYRLLYRGLYPNE